MDRSEKETSIHFSALHDSWIEYEIANIIFLFFQR